MVADSIFYEVFFVVAGGGKELIGVQGDGSKIVAFRVTGIGEGYFPGGAVGLFAVGHDTAAAKVQDHTDDVWLGLHVIHNLVTAHAFSNSTKIQGTAIKKSYIVSVHLNFFVAHFWKKSVDFGLIWDMRVLAVNVPQADDFSKGGVKSTVGILGQLADFLKVGGKIIRDFHGLALSIVQLGNLGVFLCPGKEGGFHFAELFANLSVDVLA